MDRITLSDRNVVPGLTKYVNPGTHIIRTCHQATVAAFIHQKQFFLCDICDVLQMREYTNIDLFQIKLNVLLGSLTAHFILKGLQNVQEAT